VRDFSSRPRRPHRSGGEWAVLGACALVLLVAAGSAADAWRDRRAANAQSSALRAERDAAAARLRDLQARMRGDALGNQAWLTVEAPPPRVVADLAELLPAEVRLDELRLAYGARLEVSMKVSARRAASYDLFLERLSASPRFGDVRPGDENRGGEVKAQVRAAYREDDAR
jgi:hypothetical protein